MVTRLIRDGRRIWSSDPVAERLPAGQRPIEVWAPGGGGTQPRPFEVEAPELRAGGVLEEDGVRFRVIGRCAAEDGWGTMEFWMRRYDVPRGEVLALVAHGLMDAALEEGSPTRRFRVRSDARARAWLDGRRSLRPRAPRRTR